ncbi:glycoside hydrolase family 3 C-terminal domain-containing protein [Phocaeicola coprocola]|uniref:glycoside hydrolase family 3 C-terminal domain-containing protein n=1 Tax=Phocaeicola coprocola TaxID=310298 RepID=UPI001C3800BE|nr:glycoside hydrolase family 3 C-terminal domain-containing protein [Phocaeicola coprocola]MBV3868022.1 glycoside hydrolase family 3 C-terminal domain-containing protein [Phocaeicola coprocola]MBV4009169.1 glycoside hydrolase family 3 C-terminal domain-containing protein [Phocaeicola coprocola]MBV4033657.1 glycoside hydrolase family 3 C-terminal domain-containing protein [Phocaeicola coprocola]MBV4040233.1 glycoside hydrolase family 3 C-terminal domain-containing protein [Phocaeicola coprocola
MKTHRKLFFTLLIASTTGIIHAQNVFNDPAVNEEQRLDDLIARMTLDEKVDALGNNTQVPRLGIQASGSVEGLHGIVLGGPTYGDRANTPTTGFPQAYGLGETWDTDLLHRVATYISTENRYLFQNAKYRKSGLIMWTPNVDLGRDPRWGRTEECYGEDAFLTSRLAVAFIKGIQGDHPKYWRNASLMKHFLSNSNEYGRTFSSSNYSDKLFREYYAYPFYKGVTEGGSQALMTAYNAYNGTPCIMHPVLRNIVMKEWGLNGTLLTDGGAFRLLLSDHKRFDNDRAAAAAACIKAGITKFLDEYKDAVYEALHRKLISVEDIEKAIRGNLRISLKLGLLDHAEDNPYAAIGVTDTVAPWSKPETKALVREATLKSVVLLKNKDHLLPLDRHKIKKIAVIGQRATEVLQDWYAGKPFYTVNVLDAIREEAGSDIEVRYVKTNRMDSARTVAAWADVAIVCVGNHPTCDAGWEQAPVISEGKEAVDRQSLQLDQEDLLLQVAQTNPNTIGVLISSFPYAINRANQTVPALLHLTQCSQELGHAVSDVIFGHYNPAGRLTQTWVKNITDLPHMMDYDITHGRTYMYFKEKPLYPFGYGLSYTRFNYSGTTLNDRVIERGDTLRVCFNLKNSGNMDGDEVVQLYVSARKHTDKDPIKQLKAFQRISLRKGETKKVELTVPYTELQVWDEKQNRFILPNKEMTLEIGASSSDIRLRTTFRTEE